MADMLDELISGGIDQKALVDSLRNQVQYGTAGALSGSKRLAGPGAALRDEAMGQADTYRKRKDLQEANEMENAVEAMKARMAAAERAADRAQRAADNAANRANMRGIAELREGGANKRSAASLKAKAKGKAPVVMTPEQMDEQASDFDRLAGVAGESIKRTGVLSAGFGSLSKVVPGTPAHNLEQFIAPLGSNLALQSLADLKAKSATGASGLGSITEKEIDILMSRIASLKTSQGPTQLRTALAEVQQMYAGLAAKVRAGKSEAAQAAAEAAVGGDEAAEGPVGDEFDMLMQQMMTEHPELAESFQ